jgi:molybdenum cofactor synthesis domain-containing protein
VLIGTIGLLEKKGGKSSFPSNVSAISAAMIVCSDSVFSGLKEDIAGRSVMEKLSNVQFNSYQIVPDEIEHIQKAVLSLVNNHFSLVFCCGGTGLSKRDVTPEAITPLINTSIPGIMEAARKYGQDRTPFAMLSRGVAGFINETLVITLPGSVRGALETVEAVFPHVLHVFNIRNGERHN